MFGRREQTLATVNQRLQWAMKRERSTRQVSYCPVTWWQAPPVARGVSAAWGGEEHGSSGVIVIVVADKASW